jgi:hypothetical protein
VTQRMGADALANAGENPVLDHELLYRGEGQSGALVAEEEVVIERVFSNLQVAR